MLASLLQAAHLSLFRLGVVDETSVFGKIAAPPGVADYNEGGIIGVFVFARYAIQLLMVGAGLYTLANFIMAGYTFLSSNGEAKAYTTVKDQLVASVLGLIIIIASYTATALVGYVFFGDASYILNPQISGPTPITAPITP